MWLFLFADDMIQHKKKLSEDFTRQLLNLISNFSNVAGLKNIIQ